MPKTPSAFDFECPLCQGRSCSRLVYRMPDGRQTLASLYRCGGCDFACTDPGVFRPVSNMRSRASAPQG